MRFALASVATFAVLSLLACSSSSPATDAPADAGADSTVTLADAGADGAAALPDAGDDAAALVCPPSQTAPAIVPDGELQATHSLPFDVGACTEAELSAITPCLENGIEKCTPAPLSDRCATCLYGEPGEPGDHGEHGRDGAISRFSPRNGAADANYFGCAENAVPGAGVALEQEFFCVVEVCDCPASTTREDWALCFDAAKTGACAARAIEAERAKQDARVRTCFTKALGMARRWCGPATP
jgi:hypothetical protein